MFTVAAGAHCDGCREKNHTQEENTKEDVVHINAKTSTSGVTTYMHLISPKWGTKSLQLLGN